MPIILCEPFFSCNIRYAELYHRLTPSIHTQSEPPFQRIGNVGLPTADIARMYHSSVTLTPKVQFFCQIRS
jgi:hypothetical protein